MVFEHCLFQHHFPSHCAEEEEEATKGRHQRERDGELGNPIEAPRGCERKDSA